MNRSRIYEQKRKLLSGRKNKNDVLVIKFWKRSSAYKASRQKILDRNILNLLRDFGIHLRYGYAIPPEYNDHYIENGWRSAHIFGNNFIIKYKIDGDKVSLASLGTHKDVYGSTRRSK
ncbi:MAG: hypothetical protein HC836_16620 [Richelia sp. RM2_1_2]|nr:hypothetical protein [Richelia sp. RM2_1_2]